MFRRLVATSGLLAFTLTGCAHHQDYAAGTGAAGFGETVVIVEGAASNSRMPVPVAWGTTEVVPGGIEEVRGPRAVAAEDGPYLLDTGDKLRIFVYGQPSLSRIYTVDHGGQISVPLIGHVHARGTTTGSLERSIKARLGAQYVKDPHVTVDVQQNRPFFILGEVRAAGQYPYVNGMTVQTAVAIAGGFAERADERRTQITRRINGIVEKMDVPNDYVLLPGDTLYIYERWF
jgi:polysaccharide export outer membrane protein